MKPSVTTWMVCLTLLCGAAAVRADDRTDAEKRADACIAQAIDRLKQMADAPPEGKERLFRQACDLVARAIGHDAECDARLFAHMPDPETRVEKFLRAEIHGLFARGFTAHKLWEKALGNVDSAIELHTAREQFYRNLRAEILRRKRDAEG